MVTDENYQCQSKVEMLNFAAAAQKANADHLAPPTHTDYGR